MLRGGNPLRRIYWNYLSLILIGVETVATSVQMLAKSSGKAPARQLDLGRRPALGAMVPQRLNRFAGGCCGTMLFEKPVVEKPSKKTDSGSGLARRRQRGIGH